MKNIIKKVPTRACCGAIAALAMSFSAPQVSAAETYRLSSLGPGTTPYMVMTNFANTVNKSSDDYSIVVNATGAATKHALDVAKGKTHFSMTTPVLYSLMNKQAAMYKKISNAKELSENLRSLFYFPMGQYQSVVYADSGINSLMDIKGKRVFAGPPGGVARKTSETIIEAVTGYKAGVDYDSVKLGWDSAAQAFQDKNIDVYFNTTNAPSPAITQVALSNKVRLLGIPEDKLENETIKSLAKKPGYKIISLAPDLYGENQVNTSEVFTINITAGISTHKDISDDVIYKMTKLFWENLEAQYETSPWMRSVTLENAFTDLNMPLHPGALKYYKEIGIK